jgi:hypothetical protein
MNASEIRNRLAAIVGEDEAYELLESPNSNLDGLSPNELLEAGNIAPVQTLLETLELKERARLKWLHAEPLAVEMLVPDYHRQPIQARPEREVGKVLQILDEIKVEELSENNFERKAAQDERSI